MKKTIIWVLLGVVVGGVVLYPYHRMATREHKEKIYWCQEEYEQLGEVLSDQYFNYKPCKK